MQKVCLFYSKYYDFETKTKTIGGIQTYIDNLMKVCQQLELQPIIIQYGKTDENICLNDVVIIQYKASTLKEFEAQVKKNLFLSVDKEKDIFIFMTHTIIFEKLKFKNSIAIQHGVSWDVPTVSNRSVLRAIVSRSYRAYKRINLLEKVSKVVCVDYNFLNWARTQIDGFAKNFIIIPNFTEITSKNKKDTEDVKIIFARRLCDYRGTRIFTRVISRLIEEGCNIYVTIAGTGEDEQWMKLNLRNFKNVTFISYKSDESLKIHADKHIAVVPTIGSEGTSLSLLEAMSAQCAVVCTNVGGMTNIVIDEYNGLMVSPNEEELYSALKRVIENKELREELAEKAYETVIKGFSYEKWEKKWKKVLKDFEVNIDE